MIKKEKLLKYIKKNNIQNNNLSNIYFIFYRRLANLFETNHRAFVNIMMLE